MTRSSKLRKTVGPLMLRDTGTTQLHLKKTTERRMLKLKPSNMQRTQQRRSGHEMQREGTLLLKASKQVLVGLGLKQKNHSSKSAKLMPKKRSATRNLWKIFMKVQVSSKVGPMSNSITLN